MPNTSGTTIGRWYGLAAVAIAVAASLAVYRWLPPVVPTHFGLDGTPDGWSSRAVAAFVLPAVTLGIWTLLRALPALDPRGANYPKSAGAFDVIVNAAVTLMVGLHAMVLASALGYAVPVERLVPAGLGALFVAAGNVLPRVRPNFFVGIRTPWTLSSDVAWARTHRVGGYLFTAVGAAAILAALLPPPWVAGAVLIAGSAAIVLATVAYSYVTWANDPHRGPRR